MSHLVNTDRHRQNHDIILAGLDFHTVSIPQAEPFLGYLDGSPRGDVLIDENAYI
jgi:hypothetical protein